MKAFAIGSMTLAALVSFSTLVVAEEEDMGDRISKKIEKSVEEAIDRKMQMNAFCDENPDDAKCVARAKAESERQKQQARDGLELLQDPALKGMVDKELAAEERKKLLENIKEMCEEPSSEVCKIAKQDYEDWKAAQQAR
jgi:hypothetical protein